MEGLEEDVDVLAWRSKQRVVFTLTNPVDTHQITVQNFTVNVFNRQGRRMMDLPPVRFGELVLSAHKTRSIAYEFKIGGPQVEEEELYTFEVSMGFKETEIGHARMQHIEQAFSDQYDSPSGREYDEKDYILVLLSYQFVVGEIEEDADIMLTFASIVLSILVVVIGSYLCWHAVIKDRAFKDLKA